MKKEDFNVSLPPLEPGTVLKGDRYRYEILELTSNNGGFGRIYRARCLDHYKEVAIKEYHLLDFEFEKWSQMQTWTMGEMKDMDDAMRRKFEMEANNLKELYHELEDKHIPNVLDTLWKENGRMFYAMTFIEGQTLREVMRGAMPERRAVGCIIQIAKVLHKAHRLDLIHADVSPNNIMLTRNGRNRDYAVLVDWGNAMSYNDGYTIGTSGYVAPATFFGKPQRDVYSLAATLLYLLTDKKPEWMDSEEKVEEARQLLARHNVSTETTEAILHAMNIDAEKATESIHEFMMELPKDIVIKILLNYTDNDR